MGGPAAAPVAGVVFAPASPAMAAPGAGATVGVWHVHPAMPGDAPMSSGPGTGPVHAALVAMKNAVGLRRDGQALWGWEELDFETLRR